MKLLNTGFRPLLAAPTTNNTAPAQTIAVTAPVDTANSAIIPFQRNSGVTIIPFFVGADGVTGTVVIYKWMPTAPELLSTVPQTNIGLEMIVQEYVPYGAYSVDCTAGTNVGIVGSKLVLDTERFADTVVVTTGWTDPSIEYASNALNQIAAFRVKFDSVPGGFLQVFPVRGTATSMNCLVYTHHLMQEIGLG